MRLKLVLYKVLIQIKKMARKSTIKNVKTKEVDLAPETTTKKKKRLTGFEKKSFPLFG